MKKNRKIYWLFLAPSLLGVAVFYCVPFLYAAYYAVIDNIGSGQFVGLQNFTTCCKTELFRTAAKNTLIFMALTVPLGMALALLTALCLRKISRGGSFYRCAYYYRLWCRAARQRIFGRSYSTKTGF